MEEVELLAVWTGRLGRGLGAFCKLSLCQTLGSVPSIPSHKTCGFGTSGHPCQPQMRASLGVSDPRPTELFGPCRPFLWCLPTPTLGFCGLDPAPRDSELLSRGEPSQGPQRDLDASRSSEPQVDCFVV